MNSTSNRARNIAINTALVTEAAKTAALNYLTSVNAEVAAHLAQGLEAHTDTFLINEAYYDAAGTKVSDKILQIGVSFSNQRVLVQVPATLV